MPVNYLKYLKLQVQWPAIISYTGKKISFFKDVSKEYVVEIENN